jgi:iron complex outermembrane recepter protein
MKILGKLLILRGFLLATVAGVPFNAAHAQDNAAPENVTVSASRISIQGYEAPTPVTVIGLQTLQRDFKVDIGDSIRELPSVGNSDSPSNGSHAGNASQGDAGVDTVNLRNLGTARTLTLFDGQRVVTSNPNGADTPNIGGVDLSTIPTAVISRIDVVTGGASAAWGSDAVAGVVNLVINKTFSGVKGSLTYGNDSHLDRQMYKAELSAGTDFLGGRGHTILAGTYTMSPDSFFSWNRSWYRPEALFPRASLGLSSGPALVHVGNIGSAVETNGGLIVASAAGTGTVGVNGVTALASANALRGIQFVGPGAQAVPFNFGIVSGSTCTQCSGNTFSDVSSPPIIGVPYHNLTLFSYTSFKLTDNITASLQLNFGKNSEKNHANAGRKGNTTIKSDNPFIPASVQAQLVAGGISSFTLGTSTTNNIDPHNVNFATYEKAIGLNMVQNDRQLMRGVFTLDGGYHLFGEDWSWTAYGQNSTVRERQKTPYNTYNQNYANAIDAVTVTAAGANSLGGGNAVLAAQVRSALTAAGATVPSVGSIACRSALTATSWGTFTNAAGYQQIQPGGLMAGCEPLNLFGDGNTSQAALNYIAPGRLNSSIEDQVLYIMNQAVFSASTQGTLPWGLPAGKIAVATGFEYRLEQMRATRDPLQFGATGVFESGNFGQFAGQYNVKEGFLEVNMPVLKDQLVDSLDFNAAGRFTSYSTSGAVQTWKLGVTSQLNQDIKVRATYSYDIRAPTVPELYSSPIIGTTSFNYPTGGPLFNTHFAQPGNPALVPEQATTVSGGIVLTPHWIDGLTLSADWYSISLHKGIFSFGRQQILDQCGINKNPTFCSVVFFGKGYPGNSSTPVASEVDGNGVSPGLSAGLGTFSADCEGCVNFILQVPLNATSETTSGLDFQADYVTELFDGTLNLRLLGNYNDERTRTALGATYDGAGSFGIKTGDLFGTAPKFRSTLAATYAEGAWSVTAQTRILGSARLSNYWVDGVDVDRNGVPAVIYGDARASYRLNDRVQLYGAVDNVFNAPPPIIAAQSGGTTNTQVYDAIGRSYRIGVRFED